MLDQQTADQFYTPEEYLLLEEQAEYRSEYHRGRIMAMAGASWNHNQIAGNVFNALRNGLGSKPCHVSIGDIKVWIEKENRYTYPDVMAICDDPQFFEDRTDIVVNPKVIVEVLSTTTEGTDRGDKFHASWTLDTLEEYVLIDQYRVRVEYFRQIDEKVWELRVFTKLSDVLTLQSIEVEISLDKIYRNLTWNE